MHIPSYISIGHTATAAMSDSDSDSGSDSESHMRSGSSQASSKGDESLDFRMSFRSPEPLPSGDVLIIDEDITASEERSILTCSSYTTPVTAKKKVIRRTNAQIIADTIVKNAVKSAKSEVTAAKESAKKNPESSVDTFVELKGKIHAVQPSRSNWSVEE